MHPISYAYPISYSYHIDIMLNFIMRNDVQTIVFFLVLSFVVLICLVFKINSNISRRSCFLGLALMVSILAMVDYGTEITAVHRGWDEYQFHKTNGAISFEDLRSFSQEKILKLRPVSNDAISSMKKANRYYADASFFPNGIHLISVKNVNGIPKTVFMSSGQDDLSSKVWAMPAKDFAKIVDFKVDESKKRIEEEQMREEEERKNTIQQEIENNRKMHFQFPANNTVTHDQKDFEQSQK